MRYRLPFLFGIFVVGLLVFAAVFATVEERTIHIFPTKSTGEQWSGTENVLQQTLSGSAIFDDFNQENSASVLTSSWYTNSTDTQAPSISVEQTDQTGETDESSVSEDDEVGEGTVKESREAGESDDDEVVSGSSAYLRQVAPMTDMTPVEFADSLLQSVFGEQARAEEADTDHGQTPESEPAPDESIPESDEPVTEEIEEETTPELDTTVEQNEVVEETTQGQTEEVITDESLQEGHKQTGAEIEGATGEDAATEEGSKETQDTETDTASKDDGTAQTEDLENDAAENETGEIQTGSMDEVSSGVTPEEADEDIPSPPATRGDSSGGGSGGSWGGEDEVLEENTVLVYEDGKDDDVTICGILESDCYVLSIKGFGLGWDLDDFEPKGFELKMSLGASVDARVNEEDRLYIRYFDGRTWHIANVISLRGELSNYTNDGHFSFPLPEIDDWRKLDELEVQVEYVPGGSSRAAIFVESVWIDAHYEAPADEALPELPQLFEQLQALEDSAEPDILVLDNFERVTFEHTDENEDETLIIKTDQKIYEGLTRATVYFNVTNESERQDRFHLQVHFPESRGEVTTLKQYVKNIPHEVKEPVYQPMAQTCGATWRYDEVLNQEDEPAESEPQDQTDSPAEVSTEKGLPAEASAKEEVSVQIGVSIDEEEVTEDTSRGGPAATLEQEDVSGEVLVNDAEVTEDETEVEDLDLSVLGTSTAAKLAEPIVLSEEKTDTNKTSTSAVAVSEEVEEEIAAEAAEEGLSAEVSTEEEITIEEELQALDELQPTDDFEDSTPESAVVEDAQAAFDTDARISELLQYESRQAVAGFYQCPDDDTVRYCDSLNGDETNCIQNSVQIGTETHTEYRDRFLEVDMIEGEQVVEYSLFTRAAQLFGMTPEQKEVPVGFTVRDSTQDLHRIEPGQTLYFEMEITYPAKSRGEFFIEAIGKKGAYGLLDPWWNSSWVYRMPIYVDNTTGATTTEQQIYIEIDSTLSDFWTNVQDDGDDVRFLREIEGNQTWYDASFSNRLPVTIASTSVDANLTDFPVYVNLADLGYDFWNNVGTDGADIRITTSDETSELPREVVSASTTLETGELYFRANTLSSSTDNVFYIYFGSSTASDYASTSSYGSQNVWTNNYLAVYHLEEEVAGSGNNGVYKDSTSNNEAGDDFLTTGAATGVLGNAADMTPVGITDYIRIPHTIVDGRINVIASWWMRTSDTGTQAPISGANSGQNNEYLFFLSNSTTLNYYMTGASTINYTISSVANNEWQHFVTEVDTVNNQTYLWVDGVEDNQSPIAQSSNTFSIDSGGLILGQEQDSVGGSFDANQAFDGYLDEVRFASASRTDSWIKTEYENQSTSTDFYATSSMDTYVAPVSQELDFWTQQFSSSTETARIWLQIDELEAAASTTLFMYYGNIGATSASDELTPFSYATGTDLYYVLRNDAVAGDSLLVYSYVDNNVVQFSDAGATTSLNFGEATSTLSFSSSTIVRATGPLSAKYEDSAAKNFDSLIPVGFASTTFTVAPRNNNTELWYIGSPFGNASVDMFVNGGAASVSFTVATDTVHYESEAVGNGSAGIVESDIPVLLAYEYNTGDGLAPYPATTRSIYGIRSNSVYVGITQNSTTMDVSCSITASSTSGSQSRGTRYTSSVCGNGAAGTGEAVRFYNITDPIGSIQNADADGGEASVFWPLMEFSAEYMMPVTTSYVAIACAPEIGEVNIGLYDASDTLVTSTTCTPGSDNPGKAYFGNDDTNNYTAGYYVRSTDVPMKPFYAYYEDHTDVGSGSNGGDEQNFTGPVQGRKFAYPELAYSFGAQELSSEPIFTQDHFRWYANEDAQTPTDPWPVGAEDLAEDTEITSIDAVDSGEVVRLRTSLLVENAQALAADGLQFKLQYAEGATCSSGMSWIDVGGIGSGVVWRGYNNATTTDGSTLATTTLINSDVLGTYEEENVSAAQPNTIAIDEQAEWDWVIENNSAPTNSSYCFRTIFSDGQALFNYSAYPQLVTNSAPNEPSTVTPFDNAKIADLTPTMSFVAVDAAGDDIDYEVEIDDNFDFSSPVVSESSGVSPLAFSNVTTPSDKAPFTSGNVVAFTVQSSLTDNTTYYWRVRGKDTNGSGQNGVWSSPPSSFTTDTAVPASAWFQTEWEQFTTNTYLVNVTASTSDDVRAGGEIGEYGSVGVDGSNWTTVTLQRNYVDPVIVATPRYDGSGVQRTARVRSKASDSFEIKADNHASTTAVTGVTTVDYMVVESGTWTLDDGGTGTQVVAGSLTTGGQFGNGCTSGTAGSVTFSPAFTQAPAVLHTVTSDTDTQWVSSFTYGSATGNPPSNTTANFYLMTSFAACNHTASENIDYVAIERGHGTSGNGTIFDAVVGVNNLDGANDNPTHATTFTQAFTLAPQTYLVAQMGENGGNGGTAFTDLDTAVTATAYYGSTDEDGPLADRAHADEDGGVIAFLAASGTIEALYDGYMVSTSIDFDDGTVGNVWGEFSFSDNQTNGTTTYYVEYRSGANWVRIPDAALPGNESGYTTGPIDLSGLDTDDYNVLRLYADFDYFTGTPILYDWTVTWKEIVAQPTHVAPFDNEKVASTTPPITFTTTDPEGDPLTYEIEWSTDRLFTTSSTSMSSTSAQFTNLTTPADTEPFNSGDTIQFVPPEVLAEGVTYWWRVRAVDPGGASGWSFWSDEESFTIDTSIIVSTWFQTTQEQFENDTLSGLIAKATDDVRITDVIGEYGTTTTTAGQWQTVNLTQTFSDPVVIASVRYAPSTQTQRAARVKNKTATSFDVLVSNFDTQGEGTTNLLNGASTTVDWVVVEAGTWTLDDGGTGLQIIAGTQQDVSGIQSGGSYAGVVSDTVTLSPAFTGTPMVLATVSSENDSNWVWAGIDDTVSYVNIPTTSTLGLYLQRGFGNSNHAAEDIDYVAIEQGHGTNNGVEFDVSYIAFSSGVYVDCCTSGGNAVSFGTVFSTIPQSFVVAQPGMNGGNGGWMSVENGGSTVSTSQIWLTVDEDGPNQTARTHTDEAANVFAFASTTGILKRIGGALTGTIDSQTITFSDGTGPKWGSITWTDQEPSTSTSTYHVLYATGSTFALVPDIDLPNNAVGTSTAPISLGDLDFVTYDQLRIRSNFECTAAGACPILEDWTLAWSEGIEVTGSIYEYDEVTPVTAGTLNLAINGVHQVAQSATVTGGGTFVFTNVNAFADDIITVWVDAAATTSEAVAITKYDGSGDVDGMTLFERHLSLGSDDNPTLTNTDLGQYDNSVSSNEDIIHEVNGGNDLTACVAGNGCSDVVLYIATTTTYRPGSAGSANVNTHDLTINGYVLGDDNSFTVSGSWDNNGGFDSGNGSVVFSATSSQESIDSTGAATSTFYAVTFGQGSGFATWTAATLLDVDSDFVVNYGTYFANTSSTTIGGALSIGINGNWLQGTATTTFDGSGIANWTDNTTPKQNFGKISLAGTTKTVRLQTDIVVHDITIASGNSLDITANDYAIEVQGDFRNGGTFTAQEGTVTFTATTTGRVVDPGPSSFYNMVFNGVSGNWAFPATDVTAVNDVTITSGTVTGPTGTFSIGGSFDASGDTYVHNNGTVRMTSTVTGKLVTPGSNPFYTLVFFGSGGGWSFGTAYATTSNHFQILAGSVTMPSTKLYVAGDFENEAGSFDANNAEVHMHTAGTQKFVEVSGSEFNDVRFTGSSGGGSDWYNTSWPYRFGLTVQSSQVDEDLTDFPVYIDLSHAGDHFWSNADENGADLRVAASDGTELAREVVGFATTTRTGQLFFNADAVASTTDTAFYIYYGNTLATDYADGDTYGPEAVWSNGYLAVYHLEEEVAGSGNNGVYKDSTAADEDGDDFLTTSAATGAMGNSADMTPVGITDYIRIPHTVLDGETDVIASWWMRTADTGSQAVISAANSGDNNEFLMFFSNNTTFSAYNSSANTSFGIGSISTNVWRYVVYEADDAANQSNLWVDGSPDNENPRAHTIGVLAVDAGGLILGQEQDSVGGGFQSSQALDGYLDEVRFATTSRSNGWISTEYNNQNAAASFYATTSYETIASRTFVDVNATVLGDTYIESGFVTFPSNTFTLRGSLDSSGGLFDANDGTVLFATSSTGHTIDPGGSDFYNSTFNDVAGGWTITGDATSTNNWTITAANDFTLNSGLRAVVEGTFSNNDPDATTWTGSTLALVSGTNYTVGAKTQNAETYGTLEIGTDTDIRFWQSDAASYVIDSTGSLYSQDHANVDGSLYIWGDYVRTSGVDYWSAETDFDGTGIGGAPRIADVRFASGASATFSGSTLELKGTSTATTTVQNQGSGAYALTMDAGTIDAQYYSITNTDTNGFTLLGSTSVTSLADGAYVLTLEGGSMLTLASTTIDHNAALQVQRNHFSTSTGITSGNNVTVSGTPTSYWWFRNHTGNRDGEQYDNDSGDPGDIRWDDSGYIITVSGTVYAGEGTGGPGTVCDGGTAVVTLRVNGGASYTTSCNGGTGDYSFAGVSFSGDVPLIVYLATSSSVQAATVSRTPTGNITGLDVYENYVIATHEDVDALTISHMAVYDDDDDSDIPFNASSTAGTLTVDPETALLVFAGKEFVPNGDITLSSGGSGSIYDGTLVLQATSTLTAAGTENHSIGGSWRAASDSAFTPANSTVTFTATTSGKSIQSYSSFYNASFNGVGGVWSAASDLTASQDITVNAGTLNGTSSVTVENGTVTGNGIVDMAGGTFTVETSGNFGGTTDWSFNNLTFGDGVGGNTTKIGSGDITTNGTLTIASNHTMNAGSVVWTLLGAGSAFSVSGTFNADTSTTTYATTTAMTVASESYNNLVLAPLAAGAPTYTFAAGSPSAATLIVGDGTNAVTIEANSNDPLLSVTGDVVINANTTFEASNANDFLMGGSYTNGGTFTGNGGGVVFNSTDTGETIDSGSSPFHHVSINGAGGGWTMLEHATATGNMSIQAVNTFILTAGKTLEVQGIFTNSVGGGATTWAGSELYLNSGTGYSINTKTTGADTYGTLRIGANTDIQAWNATSSVYVVAASGSLYSQDHNAVNGNLYIWGDYVRSAGSDYWSYATDFDGTDLATTSSERPVDVYFADGATTTLSGGTFEIIGDASASTTIQNQGSGTYGLLVSGGTFQANYYVIRNIDGSGLSFSGSPTIVSLSDADLLLEQNGGTMLTIAASVLDANPVKTWYRMSFATSSGVSSGHNASTTGTSVSSWRFTPTLGNYYGEQYDGDGAGDPGYLIWDDSNANITIAGNVYSDEGSTVSSVCDGSAPVVRLLVAGASPQTSSCALGDGSYSVSGIIYSPGDTITVYLDGTSTVAANVTVDPITSINNMHLYENRVIVRHEDIDPVTIAGLAAYDSDEDSDIPFDADIGSPDTFTTPANIKLIVWDSKTFEPGGNITLNSGSGTNYDGTIELQNNATLISSSTVSETITIGGSWLTGTGASFTAGLSSVNMTGTSSGMSISPDSSAFYDLTFNGSGGTWTFADTNATTTSDFTITAGTVNVASSTLAVGGSFVNSDSMSAASTSITFSSGVAETVTFNGDSVGALTFSGSGTFTMTDTDATSTDSVLISAGSVTLPSGSFAVRTAFENTGGSFGQSIGTLELYGAEAAQALRVNGSNLHNLAVSGSGSWLFVDTVATTTGTTTISSGGLTAPSVQFGIGGSLINSGTYNSNGGLTNFFATSTGHTIDAGGAVFADVILNGTGGGWTVATSATSTGAWRMQNGASFTMASSTTLEVQGIFENLIGGSATNWTDAILYLNASGTSYTVNTKSAGGDSYANVTVGDNTDVRMWNSGASTTSVATTTSSLYSMDHAAQDGDLYLWGEYTVTSGTDYWNYANDFDGAALGGGSRAVEVRIASSSAISYSGGSLNVVGSGGATTTVAVQGAGTYSFNFAGSALDMQYYQIRNTDVNGLVISGSPTVTSLSNGDFELAIDNGVSLSIAAATLNQNPTKSITNVWFGTSTGVATGTNVKADGSTSNYWIFDPTFGVFDGEYYDDDGADACGSIRWADSTCLEVSQAHYRFRADDGGEGTPNSEWYDQDWSDRKRVTITNPNSGDLTDYPVRLEIPYEVEMQSDYDDLRFTDASGTTSISYYIEDTTVATATVWAKVPTLTGSDSTNIFVYYGNSFAADAQNGSSTFIVFDDYEDNDITDYSGDTSFFAANTSFNWQKSYGLAAASGKEADKTTNGIYKTGTSIPQDTIIEFYQKVQSGQDDEPCTFFGVGGSGQNYAVCLDQYPNDLVVLAEDVTSNDGSGTTIATSSITYTSGTHWYKVRIDWLSDDSIDITVYDDTGSSVATITDSDATYSSGGFGFGFWYQAQGWDFFTARPYAASEPTYLIGSAQQGDGASWTAAQDTFVNQDSNTNFRVRLSVENSGPAIESQQFRLQYASKTGYGSCEAVPSVSYNDVPAASGCGVSEVCMVASPQFTDQAATTQHLDTSSGLDFTAGHLIEDPSNQSSSMDMATSTLTEVEYAIELTSFASESAYCLRTTDGGLDLDSYAYVPEVRVNGVPVITSWTFNNDVPIALIEGQTTVVMATGSVTDLNGYTDLLYATSTVYRSGVYDYCTADNNNCYRLTSLQCPFQNCLGNTCDIECTANIEHYAEATDVGSDYPSENWLAELYVIDFSSNVATTTSAGVELLTLWGLSLTTGEISYGSLELGQDTGTDNATSTLENTGNASIDVDLVGTDMDGGVSSTIPVGNQHYATSGFDYALGVCSICTALASTTSSYELDLMKPTSTNPVTDDVYWGIYIPSGVEGTTHYGQNTFYAKSD